MFVACGHSFAEDARGEGGDNGNGDEKGEKDGRGNGNSYIAEELTGLLLNEDYGKEDGDSCEGTGEDGPPDLGGAFVRCSGSIGSQLTMSIDVFQDNDGVVDDHADGESHSCEHDHIQVTAKEGHNEEGADY